MKPHLLCLGFFVAFISIPSSNAQIGGYLFSPPTLDKFAPNIYSGLDKNDIGGWIKNNNGEIIKNGWKPKGERYVVYRVKTLTYWFGPYEKSEAQQQALNKLYQLREKLPADAEFIFVYPVSVSPGKQVNFSNGLVQGGVPLHIPPADSLKKLNAENEKVKATISKLEQIKVENLPENITAIEGEINAIEAASKAVGEVALDSKSAESLENLREKYGKGTSQKEGMKGAFPVSYPFPKWFSLTVNILLEYFFPKLKDIMEKALTLAYMIMPDVVDRIASTLARLQDKITPDELDGALNQVAGIAEYAYNIYKDLSRLKELFTDPDFQGLLNDIDLSDVVKGLKELEKYNIDASKITVIADKYIPIGCLNSIGSNSMSNCLEEIKEITKNKVKEEVFKHADMYIKKSGIPILKDLNIGAFNDLIENEDLEKFTRKQTQSILCPHVPPNYKDNCEDFINGKYEKAAKSAINKTIQKYTKVDINKVNKMLLALENGDYLGALENIAEGTEAYYGEYFGKYAKPIKDIIKSRNLEDAKNAMDVFIRTAIDDEMVGNAIEGGAFILDRVIKGAELDIKNEIEEILNQELKKRGYNIEAIKNILKGNNEIEIKNMLEMIAKEMGITSPEAIKAIKNGNFELAMDEQIEFLKNQNLGKNGQVDLLRQNFTSKQDMLSLSKKLVNANNREKKFFMQSIKQ